MFSNQFGQIHVELATNPLEKERRNSLLAHLPKVELAIADADPIGQCAARDLARAADDLDSLAEHHVKFPLGRPLRRPLSPGLRHDAHLSAGEIQVGTPSKPERDFPHDSGNTSRG